jgi:glutaredoxin
MGWFVDSQRTFAQSTPQPVQGAAAQAADETAPRCVLLEVYLEAGQPESERVLAAVREFEKQRDGLTVVVRNVTDNTKNQTRLKNIQTHFKIQQASLPLIYGCNRAIYTPQDLADVPKQLAQMLRLDVFVRAGCQRCAEAKRILPGIMRAYPAITLRLRDIEVDVNARNELNAIVQKQRAGAVSVPVVYGCEQLIIGFDRLETTGQRIEELFKRWTVPCRPKEGSSSHYKKSTAHRFVAYRPVAPQSLAAESNEAQSEVAQSNETPLDEAHSDEVQLDEADEALLPTPGGPPEDSGDEWADEEFELPIGDSFEGTDDEIAQSPNDSIALPWFGRLNASDIGMPLFTIAVGLVDGFNPCAMWVLLFLLSILVNLRDRVRILAVAGTFVLVSGIAYFAFMAAWLNVFLIIGYLRPIQIALGLLAITVGAIHIKDFFAFKQGISLSIPESAKPGIYQRVRKIVTAEHLSGAIVGAIVLAVLVNMVELLCTAGLPAMYTQILTLQQYPAWQNYTYLALYNVAYMFDDSIMVLLVVWTLGKRKLQQREGEWLKLVSGLVVLLLGLVMIFKPQWLQ